MKAKTLLNIYCYENICTSSTSLYFSPVCDLSLILLHLKIYFMFQPRSWSWACKRISINDLNEYSLNKYWILFTLFWFCLCFPCVSAPWSWLWQEHGKTTSPPPRKLLRTSSGLCFLFWNHDLCCLSCSSLPDHSAWPQSCSCPVFSWPLLWSSSSDRETLFSWSETIPAPDTLDTSGPELTDIYEMIPDYSLQIQMMMRQWNLCCLKYHYILR